MKRTLALTVGVLLALGLVTSCSTGGEPVPDDGAAALAGRPTLAEVTPAYQSMLAELQAGLTSSFGADGWATRAQPAPTALCQDFGPQHDTGVAFLPALTFNRFIPEPTWTQSVATISEITGRHGFNPPVTVLNRADEHRIALDDRYGAVLTIHNGPKLVDFSVETGCHLRAQSAQP